MREKELDLDENKQVTDKTPLPLKGFRHQDLAVSNVLEMPRAQLINNVLILNRARQPHLALANSRQRPALLCI